MTTLQRIAKLMEEVAELEKKLAACKVFEEVLTRAREKQTNQWIWDNKDKEKYKIGGEANAALFIADLTAFVRDSLLTMLFDIQEKEVSKLKFNLKLNKLELSALQKPQLSQLHPKAHLKPAPEGADIASPAATHKAFA